MPLDFYHAAEHLWAIAHELYDKEDEARAWVEPLLHQLKHEGEAGILRSFHDFLELCATLEEVAANKIERTVRYFEKTS